MVLQEAPLGVLVLPGKSAECLFSSLRMSCLYLMFSRYISLYLLSLEDGSVVVDYPLDMNVSKVLVLTKSSSLK